MKFKKGDKVVLVKSEKYKTLLNWEIPLKTRGIVNLVEHDGTLKLSFEGCGHNQTLFPKNYDEIELEEVFNSPLYQALL